MQDFMTETFTSIGVPREEALVATDVLVEADKRGISSHGIGRLKPIYVDRVAAGILQPTAPLVIVQDSASTALVDGGLGLGLVIGPACMKLAIAKAKKTGVGVVIARNSTHYGIAG
jgi:LDH2 family malate/lactate/ureidoglycolate dehydrogenase